MKNTTKDFKSYGLYFFLYCPLGALTPLIGQYLNSIGFTGTQVGIVTSMGTASAVLFGLIWGRRYSNTQSKRRLIAIMFVAAGAFSMLTLSTKAFLIYTILYAGMYAFQGPVYGMCDSLVIANGENFPRVRAFGAIGFSIAVYITGSFAEARGLESIFYIYAITFVIAAAIVLRMKEPPHYKRQDGLKKNSCRELFHDKKYVHLLICSFFVFGCAIANSTYFGYLYREGGGTIYGIGVAFLLMAGSEAVFMLLVPRINKVLPTEKLTVIAVGLCALRFAFYSFGPGYKLLLGTFFLQGMSNGIIWVEFIKYFGKITEPRLSSLAISTFHAIGNNFSSILCSLAGGMILDAFGARGCYLFFAIWNGIAFVLYLIWGLQRKDVN